jgi:hypothetical protein
MTTRKQILNTLSRLEGQVASLRYNSSRVDFPKAPIGELQSLVIDKLSTEIVGPKDPVIIDALTRLLGTLFILIK